MSPILAILTASLQVFLFYARRYVWITNDVCGGQSGCGACANQKVTYGRIAGERTQPAFYNNFRERTGIYQSVQEKMFIRRPLKQTRLSQSRLGTRLVASFPRVSISGLGLRDGNFTQTSIFTIYLSYFNFCHFSAFPHSLPVSADEPHISMADIEKKPPTPAPDAGLRNLDHCACRSLHLELCETEADDDVQ